MQAIAALVERLDNQVLAVSSDKTTKPEDVNNTVKGSNAQVDMMTGVIDQRLSALEMTMKNLAVKNVIEKADGAGETTNSEVRDNANITSSQVNLLVMSGLLADNLAGAPIGRWIDLLQKVANQGIAMPHLDQLDRSGSGVLVRMPHL